MTPTMSDDRELLAALADLSRALGSADRSEWVDHYTDDAVFVGPGAPAVHGRAALLEMASSMGALSSVSVVPVRTEMSGDLAAVYATASWVSGEGTDHRSVALMRGILVWRKGHHGRWRVAQELLHPDPQA